MRRLSPRSLIIIVALSLLLGLHAAYFWPFLCDDALISLRYSRRWVEGNGLTWSGAERVEGYSNFLWVVLVAAGGRLGFDYIWTARALDFLGSLAALFTLGISPTQGRFSPGRLLAGGAFFVTSVPVAVWTIGGLEHGFTLGVLAVALFLLEKTRIRAGGPRRDDLACGLPFAALALLRADGFVLIGSALAAACFLPRLGRQALWRTMAVSLPPAVALLLQLGFRRIYYGAWVPNTAVAKVAINGHRLRHGLRYLLHGYAGAWVLLLAAAGATVWLLRQGKGRSTLSYWAVVVGWSGYQLLVGGDNFPAWRQLVFVVVALSAIVATAAEWLPSLSPTVKPRALAGLMAASALHLAVGELDGENRRAKTELWNWEGLPIGKLLKRAFGSVSPLLAVDAAGGLPYWSELPSLDMLGLNDRYIAHHPPPTFGTGSIGHELGDGAYVYRSAPDLIAFNGARGERRPTFLSGKQLVAMSDFRKSYQWIRVRGAPDSEMFGELWVRRAGGKLGIVRAGDRVQIPGYFFTGQMSDTAARLDGRERLVAEITDDHPGVLPPLTMVPGRYRIVLVPPDPSLVIGVACGARPAELRPDSSLVLDVPEPTELSLSIAPRRGTFELERVELVSEPGAVASGVCAPPAASTEAR